MLNRRKFLAGAAVSLVASAAERPPNVVFIYADDLGYGDLGCYGGSNETPNLDRMAREGMRFTQALSANPVCSPSRAALLTGRYPTRVMVPVVLFPTDKGGLPDSEQTMAQLLKTKGYSTMCVGKWHLGHMPPYLPTSRGFDHYFGIPYSNDMNPRWLMQDTKVIEEEANLETLTSRYTAQAVGFIEQAKDKPFYLYFPHTYPHIPLGASPKFRGKSANGIYGDVLAELDWSVGEVLAAVKKIGQDRNTLIIFSSDNGPWYQGSPGHLRGRKGMTWEGGVREPFIARWPGKIPAGRVCQGLVSMMDVFPTVAKLAGVKPTNVTDGVDIWPLLSGQKQELEREALLYFDNWNLQCIRLGRWKLHITRYNSVTYSPVPAAGRKNIVLKTPELYNVISDPDESFDVADKHPAIVDDLMKRAEKLIAGFPEQAQKAYFDTKNGPRSKAPVGQVTRE